MDPFTLIPRVSQREFIRRVSRAYDLMGDPNVVNDVPRLLMTMYAVMRTVQLQPELLQGKRVRHNLGVKKLAWLDGLGEMFAKMEQTKAPDCSEALVRHDQLCEEPPGQV